MTKRIEAKAGTVIGNQVNEAKLSNSLNRPCILARVLGKKAFVVLLLMRMVHATPIMVCLGHGRTKFTEDFHC